MIERREIYTYKNLRKIKPTKLPLEWYFRNILEVSVKEKNYVENRKGVECRKTCSVHE